MLTTTTAASLNIGYAGLVAQAIHDQRGTVEKWLTTVCPECGLKDPLPARNDPEEYHTTVNGYVVVGCEGYHVIHPAAVDLDSGAWTDWTEYAEVDA